MTRDKARTTKEAAAAVGISLMTLQRWIAAGKVEAPELRIRKGRAVRLWNERALAKLRNKKKAIYLRGRGRKKKNTGEKGHGGPLRDGQTEEAGWLRKYGRLFTPE